MVLRYINEVFILRLLHRKDWVDNKIPKRKDFLGRIYIK